MSHDSTLARDISTMRRAITLLHKCGVIREDFHYDPHADAYVVNGHDGSWSLVNLWLADVLLSLPRIDYPKALLMEESGFNTKWVLSRLLQVDMEGELWDI